MKLIGKRYGTACFCDQKSSCVTFVKVYLYDPISRVKREFIGAKAALESGLHVPTPMGYGLCPHGVYAGKPFIEYQYLKLPPVSHVLYETALPPMLEMLRAVPIPEIVSQQHTSSVVSWRKALELGWSELATDSEMVPPWSHLDPFAGERCFLHGDLSPENLGQAMDTIGIYDFGDCTAGPCWWDAGYIAGLLFPGDISRRLTASLGPCHGWAPLLAMTVRLGRAIQSGKPYGERKELCLNLFETM